MKIIVVTWKRNTATLPDLTISKPQYLPTIRCFKYLLLGDLLQPLTTEQDSEL